MTHYEIRYRNADVDDPCMFHPGPFDTLEQARAVYANPYSYGGRTSEYQRLREIVKVETTTVMTVVPPDPPTPPAELTALVEALNAVDAARLDINTVSGGNELYTFCRDKDYHRWTVAHNTHTDRWEVTLRD